MSQYEKHLRHIYENGFDILNERTGKNCRTVISLDMEYNVGAGKLPVVTTRKVNYDLGTAELLGYICGDTSAAEFRKKGTKTWDANANENAAWLANPHRKGEDDVGFVYGKVARNWPSTTGPSLDLIRKVYDNLRKGVDDRGEIITFWNPGEFNRGCLRPCMYEHQFSIVNGVLYLNSTQRSADWPLGTVQNAMQCYVFLALMAQITGLKPGIAYHRSINCHIYGDQILEVPTQLAREPLDNPDLRLWINPDIKTLEDIETWVTIADIKVLGYDNYHPAIKYPFAV